MPHISLAAEKLWNVWGMPISNSLLATWLAMAVIFILAYLATRKLTLVPSNGQSIAELLIGGLYDFFSTVAGHHIKEFFPLIASLFIFIITANWMGLLPGVGTVGFFHTPVAEVSHEESAPAVVAMETEETTAQITDAHETEAAPAETGVVVEEKEEAAVKEEAEGAHEGPAFTPILRGATADLNTTVALAIIAVIAIQYFGFKTVGKHYSTRFVNFKDPIYFVLGILELVSEFSKIISFAFRLFGNIFAGEVLLTVMAFLMPFIVPLPFLMLELFVGFIQALVFSMLTTVFLNVAVSHGDEH